MGKLLFSESKAVCMTEDKKCIMRGRGKYNRKICLVDEKSKLGVLLYKSVHNVECYSQCGFYKIALSDGVKKLYNTESNVYDAKTIGKLIGVKINANYEIA